MAAAPLPAPTRHRYVRPLEAARAALQRELDPRYVQFPSFAHKAGAEPLVVPLGVADLLGDVIADPYAMVRSRATLHLTGRSVLVGPWGGGAASGPASCGMCLGLHWQRLRRDPVRAARARGHGRLDRRERPALTSHAVDIVRAVWTAVFGSPDRDDTPAAHASVADAPGFLATGNEGLPRVTCVDLRTPVPRSYLLLAEPPCGHHTGCRG